ncbi:MAG: CIA30 family protein [Dehalococcoidales bacterium]|jgi:hypothetical protein
MKNKINPLLAMIVCGAFVLPNSGKWYTKDDSPDKGASTINFKLDEKTDAAGGDGSINFEYSLGKGFQWPYVQLLYPLSQDGQAVADLSGYSGISLWAKTEGKAQVRLVIFTSEDGVTDMSNSGTYRHNEASIKTSDKFVLYKIPFEQFKTPQWWLSQHPKANKQADWSKSIEFAVMEDDSLSAGASEKGWIDDITFYRGPLEIKGAIPADKESGVKADSAVKISFNFPVAVEELQKNFKLIKVDRGGKPVECNITVSADGRELTAIPVKPLDAKSRYLYKIYRKLVNFTTEYGIGNIYGRVTDEKGEPVADASIRTYPDDKRTRTDEDGRYYFEGVNLDRICLYCVKDGYYTGFGVLPLVPKEDFYVDFRLSEVPKRDGKVQPYIFGVNFNDWETEGYLLPVKDKVKAAGFTIMRWGGIGKDLIEVDEAKIDEFISYAKAVKTEPVVQVRLIKGSIEEAVKAVKYCNIAKRYKVKYWIIGNEPDWYNQKEWGPYGAEDYCRDYRAYYNAMKAIDPSIKIMGPELTAKYYLAAPDNWIEPFLRECGDIIDVISIHLYPYSGKQPPQQTLMGLGNYRRVIDSIRQKTKEIAGREIPIAVTEYNLTWDWLAEGDGANNSFYAGLYLADFLGTMAEKQVFIANFWDIMERGTIGFLEHETFKPYPAYYTFMMYKNFRGELIDVKPDRKELKAYGAKDKGGNVILMVINKSGSKRLEAELAPAALKTAKDRYYSFPPYSLTCLKISSGGRCAGAWQYSKELYDKGEGMLTGSELVKKTVLKELTPAAARPGSPISRDLLDDFESGDYVSPMGGAWIPEDDSVNGGDSTSKISLSEGCGSASGLKFEYTLGGKFNNRYSICAAVFDGTIDLSKYKKMVFRAKGAGKPVKIKICSASVGDYDYHGTVISPAGEWAEYSISLPELKQEGWGRKTDIDLTQVNKIQFESGTKTAGDEGFIVVDDIRFE